MLKRHVNKELSAYCHGELSAEDQRRVAEHLLGCQRCRREYEEIKLGVFLAGHLSLKQAPAELWDEIAAALSAPRTQPVKRPKSFRFLDLFDQPRLALASAAMLLVLGIGGAWLYLRLSRPAWEVEILKGRGARVGAKHINDNGQLAVGEMLETDDESRARISVGEIGHVEVDPNTRIRLVNSRANDQRLALERGTMYATISAPPRLFAVETPSATAVDLGCAYTLEVDESGAGFLHVTYGWVAFEVKGRESFVPRGAKCVTRPGRGPGTPYYEDVSERFEEALTRLDFETLSAAEHSAALEVILAESRKQDGLTLWHLLTRTSGEERARVYDRMAALVPPPEGITREGVLGEDRRMLDRWWDELGLRDTTWWRLWKGPWPPKAN